MVTAKDCFEAGLFLIGTAWGDRMANPGQYIAVKGQAQTSLSNLKIDKDFVKKVTLDSTTSININERLRWVAGTVDTIRKEVQPLIEGRYGNRAVYCCQAGVDLGNLMFASGVLGAVGADAAVVRPFLDNLKNSSIRIGEPEVLKEFIGFCESLLSSSSGGSGLANVPGKATACAQKLAIWIETNIAIQEKESVMERSIPEFIAGIPYVGKGLAELYKGRKKE
jgi:hypothetical protein